jgi:AcrR family transcriptional regulator
VAAAEPPRWNRLEHDERRAQILACARRLFSERHYEAVPMAEIAREAGVARGLLHHYFGTKRELFLEVVRSMVELPADLFPADETGGRRRDEVLGEAVDRWLEMLERNRGTWLASLGAQGFGRDPELEAVLDEARERAVDRLVALVREDDHAPAASGRERASARDGTPELRALLRSFGGLAEAASLEWLERRRLTREQVKQLLLRSLLALVGDVLPEVEAAGRGASRARGRQKGGTTRRRAA